MVKQFHVTVTYGPRKLLDFDTATAAIISEKTAGTCCTTGDVAVRIVLAARVNSYLNSLIKTIVLDTGFEKEVIQRLIDEIVSEIELDERYIDPNTGKEDDFDEIIERLNKARREEGGNG